MSRYMCSRCLRGLEYQISSPPSRRILHVPARRAFTAAQQPLRRRNLHSSTAQRTAIPTESQRSSRNVPPPPSRPDSGPNADQKMLLRPNNLFHSYTNSPSPAIRKRAAFMKQNAYCSHPDHQSTRIATSPHDPEARKTGSMPPAHVRYECPDCGIPVSCSEEHFASDYESHLEICDVLREINEDDHDLVSGRFFPEFEYPGPQLEEAQVNMMNWDTLLYTREFVAIDNERPLRQVTRLLTYPITIGSVLHELSPYSLSNRLEPEGLRSLAGESTCLRFRSDPLLTVYSSALYTASTAVWRWYRRQGSANTGTACPTLHSRSPCRVIAAPTSLAATLVPLPASNFPSHLHWTGSNGESGRRIPTTGTDASKPIWSHCRGPAGRSGED